VDRGLERLAAALSEGGHPERQFPAVQVAGTNGKGSICTMLHAILRAAGVHCATYRSPHLVSWCERLQIDDDWISAAALRQDLTRWQSIGRRHGLTPFELLTAAAFSRCAAEGVELAVLEVGLGGRLDATTTHPDRSVVGIASIGMDHREHLGDTLTAIAFEKAGVMGPGALAFSGPQPPAAACVLEAEARRLGADLRWVEPLPAREAGGPLLGLGGELQRTNAAVAVAMAEALAERGWPLPPQAIINGLASARWPGRFERHHWRGRPLLIDGAHNPPAAAALRRELDRPGQANQGEGGQANGTGAHGTGGLAPVGGRRWLIGIQRHKEGGQLLHHLLRPGDRAAIVPLTDHPSWRLGDLAAACPDLAGCLQAVDSPREGLEWLTAGDGALPVVAGSLLLLGEVLPLLDRNGEMGKSDPAAGDHERL
jgi:dihydrofolate synthase / folylpolyglutamate synthase